MAHTSLLSPHSSAYFITVQIRRSISEYSAAVTSQSNNLSQMFCLSGSCLSVNMFYNAQWFLPGWILKTLPWQYLPCCLLGVSWSWRFTIFNPIPDWNNNAWNFANMTVIKLFTIILVINREILSFSTYRDLGRVYKFKWLSDINTGNLETVKLERNHAPLLKNKWRHFSGQSLISLIDWRGEERRGYKMFIFRSACLVVAL